MDTQNPEVRGNGTGTDNKKKAGAVLTRTTFTTNRTLEFFSRKELQMQIGHPVELWPAALVKELIDNALDACENAGIAPEIEVTLDDDAVSVRDNGPGLPVATLTRSLDYMVRVSDKAYYVSPSRGQLGNALKCVWAAPFVENGQCGCVEVITGGTRHRIDVTLDRIAQNPNLEHTFGDDGVVKSGTLIRMHWPGIASYLGDDGIEDFYNAVPLTDLVIEYAAFNPHARFEIHLPGRDAVCFDRTDGEWRKWRPQDPTSPHWYTVERLRALITAYLAEESESGRRRTVREFVSEFAGLSGTAKQKLVTEMAGLSGAVLSDLIRDGNVDETDVGALLVAMKSVARVVNPPALGILGEEHFRRCMTARGAAPDSVFYRKAQGLHRDTPYILETAFGVLQEGQDHLNREVAMGVNWTPTLAMPFQELARMLGEARVYPERHPVAMLVHLAYPGVSFTDRGKTHLALPLVIIDEMRKAVRFVTRHWTEAMRQADRENRVRTRELDELRKASKPKVLSIKAAAYQVMEEAYLKASAAGRYPAHARQIMYAARPLVLALTEGKCWKNSSSFTQGFLPDFVEAHPDLTANWDVVYDARGRFVEPHTERRIDLGTVEVRRYIAGWAQPSEDDLLDVEVDHDYPTAGPQNRYKFALFIEKEGFDPLLKSAEIANRFDIAVMSTKGMSVTAARSLVERLSEEGVTILVLHDFDKSGFSILHTLQSDTRRYRFRTRPKMIDLGLRLVDAVEMALESEPVDYDSGVDPRKRLRECGATEEECDFLVQRNPDGSWSGQRVELNAMDSAQFITFLERKLVEAGVGKFVPPPNVIKEAFRRAHRRALAQEAIDKAIQSIQEMGDDEIDVPENIEELVSEALEATSQAWDTVVWDLVIDPRDEEEAEDQG